MDPITTIAAASAAIDLVQRLLPIIDQMVKRGEVSAELQAEVRAKAESLKTQSEGQFSGPHWKIDP